MAAVTVTLMGRLGNQLFQAACAIGAAKTLGLPVLLPNDVQEASSNWDNWLHALPRGRVSGPRLLYSEPSFAYKPLPVVLPTGVSLLLLGYWQSAKYFSHAIPEVLAQLRLPDEQEQRVNEVAHGLRQAHADREFVMLHIRRGDYLRLPHVHVNQPDSYYRETLEQHFRPYDAYVFVVCSDDLGWCRGQDWLASLPHVIFLDSNTDYGFTDAMELGLVQHLCEHFVIANSSYSWWAAFLAEQTHPERAHRVFMPDRWHLSDGVPVSHDLACEGWTVVQT